MKSVIILSFVSVFCSVLLYFPAEGQDAANMPPASVPTALPSTAPTAAPKKPEAVVPKAAPSVVPAKKAPAPAKKAVKKTPVPVKRTSAGVKNTEPKMYELDARLSTASEKVVPSVVTIRVARADHANSFSVENNPSFPFNAPSTRPETMTTGSGIILDKRGNIVTNYHVVRDFAFITVQLNDMREYTCDMIGADPVTDIAVIRIALNVPPDIIPAVFADSSKVKTGQLAVAVGNSYNFQNTVSAGVISAVGRPGSAFAETGDFLQTDAALNPGNSGGALADSSGRVVGMNTAVYSRSGGTSGLGFSIPANTIKDISAKIIASGMVIRGWSGLMVQELNPDRAVRLNLPQRGGAVVSDTIKNSPASSAGIMTGDIILSADGKAVSGARVLHDIVIAKKPGDKLSLTVLRNGKKIDVNIFMGNYQGEVPVSSARSGAHLGFGVSDVDEDAALRYGITDKNGVVVTRIDSGLSAESSGLEPGDLLLEIEGRPVPTLESFSRIMENNRARNSLVMMLKRHGTQKIVTVYMK
jgi:serine protease Do